MLNMTINTLLNEARGFILNGDKQTAIACLTNALHLTKSRRADAIKWRAQRGYIAQAITALS